MIVAFALLINVGSFGVVESSDARYAEIAREMFASGDFIHPNLLDVHHYHKPPFTYQITALGYWLFGVNSFAARFFLQIAVLLQLILVYALTDLLFRNKQTALLAAVIYISYPIVLVSSRNLTTDAFLTTFVLWSIYSFVKYRKTGDIKNLYFFTISLALGFLTKGPVVFIVPVFFILFFARTEKASGSFNIHHLLAWLLFIVIASSWFVYLAWQNTDFINYFLGRQTADRFSKNVFDRSEPFWYFWAFAPLVGLPWLVLLPYLIKQQIKLFTKRSVYVALLLGCLIPLIFFSISSSKRILYILLIYGLLAILTAQLVSVVSQDKSKRINNIIAVFSLIIALAMSGTIFLKMDMKFPVMLGVFNIIVIGSILMVYRSKKIDLKSKLMALSLITATTLVISSSIIMSSNQLKINSPKPVTDFILKENLNNREILVYNTRKPSIAFGLNKSIVSLYNGSRDLDRETQFETDLNWKNYLVDMRNDSEVQYLRNVMANPTVLLLYKDSLPDNLNWMLSYYKESANLGKWTVYY